MATRTGHKVRFGRLRDAVDVYGSGISPGRSLHVFAFTTPVQLGPDRVVVVPALCLWHTRFLQNGVPQSQHDAWPLCLYGFCHDVESRS